MMHETIVDTKNIYSGRLVTLDLHEVQLPNGEHSKREVVTHPGAVAVVALDDDHSVLMVRQFRLPAGKVLLEIPAGTLDPGESPEACASRELQEETSYKPNYLESLGGIYTAPGYTTEFIHLFLATNLTESSLDMDVDEFVEMEWMPLSEAVAKIERDEIVDSKTVSGLLRVARRLGI